MFSLHALLDALPYLIKAAQATVLISLVGLVVGFVVAIAVCSARLSKNRFVSKLGGAYVVMPLAICGIPTKSGGSIRLKSRTITRIPSSRPTPWKMLDLPMP